MAGSTPLLRARALLNLLGLVGQQWLGGLVDSRNWTDAWYAEGSVIYLQHTLLDKASFNVFRPHGQIAFSAFVSVYIGADSIELKFQLQSEAF